MPRRRRRRGALHPREALRALPVARHRVLPAPREARGASGGSRRDRAQAPERFLEEARRRPLPLAPEATAPEREPRAADRQDAEARRARARESPPRRAP